MPSGDLIEFKNEDISNIASITRTQQTDFDNVWETTRARLGNLVSQALDALTGSSLDERTVEYHQKTVQYSGDMGNQHNAMVNIGNISVDTNQQMSRVIRGA